jgi:hypothetical protein
VKEARKPLTRREQERDRRLLGEALAKLGKRVRAARNRYDRPVNPKMAAVYRRMTGERDD